MNKTLYASIFLFLICCAPKVPPIIKPVLEPKFSGKDTIVFWSVDDLKKSEYYSINDMTSLLDVKKIFKIYNGKLFNTKENFVVSNINLQLRTDTLMGEDVEIRNGLPYGHYCDWRDGVTCRMDIHYDDLGNMDGYFSVQNYNTTFSKGNGYWKDYYIDKEIILKAEGKVKNNFKFGEWKYYNKEGKIDSIKTYSLKDSVDVRFPHCIFNKKEPCFCEKK
jgi:hypothetical protein